MANFGVGVSYIYRKYSDLLGTYRTQDFTEAYVPATFTAHCGNAATCGTQSYSGTYYQRPTALHAATILRNDTKYNTYNGVEFTARKRLANKWMMNGSLVWNHQLHFEPDANIDYLDPTNHAPIDLINGYESGGHDAEQLGGRRPVRRNIQRPQRAGRSASCRACISSRGASTSRRTSTGTPASRTTRTS